MEEIRTFGSDEVMYVELGPSIASQALAKARALFMADRIDVEEFERRVEQALNCEPWSIEEWVAEHEPLFDTPHMDRISR